MELSWPRGRSCPGRRRLCVLTVQGSWPLFFTQKLNPGCWKSGDSHVGWSTGTFPGWPLCCFPLRLLFSLPGCREVKLQGLKGRKMPPLLAFTSALTRSFQLPLPWGSVGPTRGTKEGREFWDALGGAVRSLSLRDVLRRRQLRVIQRRARTEEPLCCAFPPGQLSSHLPRRHGERMGKVESRKHGAR